MGFRTRIQVWLSKIGESYPGSLLEETRYPFFWLITKLLARVRIDEDFVAGLKELAEQGIVVYAIKNPSQLNCLILRNLTFRKQIPSPVYCHGISMLLWQPFSVLFKVLLTRVFSNAYQSNYLTRITKDGKSSVIYLRGSEFIGSTDIIDPLFHLIHAQKKLNVPIFLVPALVAYGRRREKKDKTVWDLLFGQSENPGKLKRLIMFLRYSKKTSMISAEPLNLQAFLRQNRGKNEETLSYLIRRRLIDRIDEEKRTLIGPVLRSREEIISMVLRDPALVKFMEVTAFQRKKAYKNIVKEARKYLYEIATDYSETYIGLWDKFLTWLWNDIYDGVVVDKEGLSKLRSVSRKMPFVVIPCHRSHIDYLFLSYVFYHNNIQMPFIAAGTNLMFWPLGHLFRKSGAFFLRRSFKGEALYGEVFTKYIKVLLKEGFPVEFFIEGGRSRTGKMVMPKYGMLSMVIQAYRERVCDDLAIIPVFIGYDRVIEEKSYLKELGGGEKAPEKASSLLKSRKILKKRYGSVYLNVGEPVLLKSYFANLETPFEAMSVVERQCLYRKMGYEIAHEINEISVVSPVALVAAVLLCHSRKGFSHDEAMNLLDEFYEYLNYKRVRFSSTFANKDKALHEALSMFESSGYISKIGPDEEDEGEFAEIVYSIEEDKRLNLEYYKNNILHFFIPLSFVSISIVASTEDEISLSKIIGDYSFFKRLFRHEFIFDDTVDGVEEVNAVLSYMYDKEFIAGYEDGQETIIKIKGKGRRVLHPFAGLIRNYIESYWITLRGCSYLRNKVRGEKDFLRRVQKLGTKMYRKGEVLKAESLSRSNYQGALNFLIDAEVILVNRQEDKDFKNLALSDDKIQIEYLRHKLYEFIQ